MCHHHYLRFVSNHLYHFKPLALIFAGPMYVRSSNSSSTKVCLCLYTCGSTRFVHLQCVYIKGTSETIQQNDSRTVLSPIYIRTVTQLNLCTRDAGTPTIRFNMADPEIVFLALRHRCSGQQSLRILAVLRRCSSRRKLLLVLILSTFLMHVMTE